MATNVISEKKKLKAIRKQLEFYFSEGNLPHDKFMQKCIESSKEQSVQITDLLKFNKLINMGATEENILRAVSKSVIITLDIDGSGIKRKIELSNLKPANSRTLYVCGFSISDSNVNIDTYLRQIFIEYGEIVRVDIPKYPSSNTLKGFAFIEFLTRTAARAAMSVHKPEDKNTRKAGAWKYFSYCNSQYSHALKQMEMLGHSQKLFFDNFLGEQRKLKGQDKLIVVAKKEWLQFKTEFYEAQKCHLNEMKILINKYQVQQAVQNPSSHKLHERTMVEDVSRSSTTVVAPVAQDLSNQIISGSIVEFCCGEGHTKKTIKALLSDCGANDAVAYIDFKDFAISGFLRFKGSDSAVAFVGHCPGFDSTMILTPDREREYIDRITIDKEMKKESQKRKNQRKKNKVSHDSTDPVKIEN